MFKAEIIKNPADDRPINPGKIVQYGGIIDLEVIPEKSKKLSGKQFLKKKKVYDPNEAIKKAKQTKSKFESDRSPAVISNLAYENSIKASKSPSKKGPPKLLQLDKSRSENVEDKQSVNNFANMNKQQRVQKISQLLRQNRPF